ncbi:hypothetical protein WN48_05315 [Eufriesea mexicana]|uniref:Uncharacterized protein n=1 Tax=Eufriesea mexicana TaxID=516756 RepID=A0A310SDI2_9HYME|nr:hypothetical protein WN48_05315 [Eufriesea mexicana]
MKLIGKNERLRGRIEECERRVEKDVCADVRPSFAAVVEKSFDVTDESASNVCKRWVCKNVCWEEYANDLRECAVRDGMNFMNETNVDRLVDMVMKWIQEVNGKRMKELPVAEGRREGRCSLGSGVSWGVTPPRIRVGPTQAEACKGLIRKVGQSHDRYDQYGLITGSGISDTRRPTCVTH